MPYVAAQIPFAVRIAESREWTGVRVLEASEWLGFLR